MLSIVGCETLPPPSPAKRNPLVVANCPKLAPLSDDSFGATTAKLVDVSQQYNECRAAALAER